MNLHQLFKVKVEITISQEIVPKLLTPFVCGFINKTQFKDVK